MTDLRDEKVRSLVERGKAGIAATWDEIIDVCPFRYVMSPPTPMRPRAAANTMVAVIGFEREDFSDRMMEDILRVLRNGQKVLIISNSALLLRHTREQVLLAMSDARGSA